MRGNDVVAFGATVPLAAIENAPMEAPMAWPPVAVAEIPLSAAVTGATGLKLMNVYWEAHGHPPGAYMTPHFDFHFYTVEPGVISAIDCSDTTKPTAIPTGYVLPDIDVPGLGNLVGLCVPGMGMHALPEAVMSETAPFAHAMLVGYEKGVPIFIEPMIARAALMERKGFALDVPPVSGVPAGVHFPTRFKADYDSTSQSYRFTFSAIAGPKAN